VFHLEIRQRPHMTRAFNLSEQELTARFLAPFAAGQTVHYADRDWEPRKAKLTVYEGPELRPEEIGMGRGWANVTRHGTDVTDRTVGNVRTETARDPALDRLRERVLGRLAAGPAALREVVPLADDLLPGHRASERLALAEIAVWELLHQQQVELVAGEGAEDDPVPAEEWQSTLLDWTAWALGTSLSPRLRLGRGMLS
jgi:hypothetical protein